MKGRWPINWASGIFRRPELCTPNGPLPSHTSRSKYHSWVDLNGRNKSKDTDNRRVAALKGSYHSAYTNSIPRKGNSSISYTEKGKRLDLQLLSKPYTLIVCTCTCILCCWPTSMRQWFNARASVSPFCFICSAWEIARQSALYSTAGSVRPTL